VSTGSDGNTERTPRRCLAFQPLSLLALLRPCPSLPAGFCGGPVGGPVARRRGRISGGAHLCSRWVSGCCLPTVTTQH